MSDNLHIMLFSILLGGTLTWFIGGGNFTSDMKIRDGKKIILESGKFICRKYKD